MIHNIQSPLNVENPMLQKPRKLSGRCSWLSLSKLVNENWRSICLAKVSDDAVGREKKGRKNGEHERTWSTKYDVCTEIAFRAGSPWQKFLTQNCRDHNCWGHKLLMKSTKLVIPLDFISWVNSFSDISRKCILPDMIGAVNWKKTPNNGVTPQRLSQFTPKMKANAVSRLLSSLVWIDLYNECYRFPP